jgi:hypothetical protein
MKDIILLKDFMAVLSEFPEDTPVLFLNTKPDEKLSVSCDFYQDSSMPDGSKKDVLVFLYDFNKEEDEENK